MSDFFQTIMGRQFYDGTMPALVKELKRIADALERVEMVEATRGEMVDYLRAQMPKGDRVPEPIRARGAVREPQEGVTALSNDLERCEAVARELRERGVQAVAEHTGGGVFCVVIETHDGGSWVFGMADAMWAGGYSSPEGEYADRFYVTTEVPSSTETTHAGVIANGIHRILTPYTQGAAFLVR